MSFEPFYIQQLAIYKFRFVIDKSMALSITIQALANLLMR